MRAEGYPDQDVADTIRAWREDGWEPRGQFATDCIVAYGAARSGAGALADRILAPWIELWGPAAAAEAMALLHARLEYSGRHA